MMRQAERYRVYRYMPCLKAVITWAEYIYTVTLLCLPCDFLSEHTYIPDEETYKSKGFHILATISLSAYISTSPYFSQRYSTNISFTN